MSANLQVKGHHYLPKGCERISRGEVPQMPAEAKRQLPNMPDVYDLGQHRWRYEGGDLVTYIEYASGNGRWLRCWHRGQAEPKAPEMTAADLGDPDA